MSPPGQRTGPSANTEAGRKIKAGGPIDTIVAHASGPEVCRRIARAAWERRNRGQYVEFARCCPGQYAPLRHEECCP